MGLTRFERGLCAAFASDYPPGHGFDLGWGPLEPHKMMGAVVNHLQQHPGHIKYG